MKRAPAAVKMMMMMMIELMLLLLLAIITSLPKSLPSHAPSQHADRLRPPHLAVSCTYVGHWHLSPIKVCLLPLPFKAIIPGEPWSAISPRILLFHLFEKRISGDWWNEVFVGRMFFMSASHECQITEDNTNH